MAARVQLNNFRFSIYIDAGGTVTFTDLPSELREIAEILGPAHLWGTTCPVSPHLEGIVAAEDSTPRQTTSGDLVGEDGHG
jgi:hypothetical protein